jgi:plastocyanin
MGRRSGLALLGALLLIGGFAALPAQAGGCHPESTEPSSVKGGDGLTVPMKACEFGPTVVHVPEGATVTWVNQDPVPHTVTGALLAWGGMKEHQRGDEVRFRFDDSGTFPYYCILHPGMAGAVVVGDGTNDEILAAPVAVPPPSSGDGPSSTASTQQRDSGDGMSSGSMVALAALALAAGAGAGIAFSARGRARITPTDRVGLRIP